jgi:hypothetical protein
MNKKLVVINIGLLCCFILSTMLPPVPADENNDANLKATLMPLRKVFPRIYFVIVIAQFDYGYMCYDASYEGGGTITFQIERIFGGVKEIVHSESKGVHSEEPGSGVGWVTEYQCTVDEGSVNIYRATTILDIQDSEPSDNEASCLFMAIR